MSSSQEEIMSHAGIEFHFRNCEKAPINVRVHHYGCGGVPWHDDRACCWSKDIPQNPLGGQHSVYNPASFVVNFTKWMDVVLEGLKLVAHAGMFVISEGEDLKALAEAIADALEMEQAIAEAELGKIDLSQAHQSLENACQSIGVSEGVIRDLHDRLGLSPNAIFIAGPTYDHLIRTRTGTSPITGEHGWTCLAQIGKDLQMATGAFLYKDALIYAIDHNIPQLWRKF